MCFQWMEDRVRPTYRRPHTAQNEPPSLTTVAGAGQQADAATAAVRVNR
jgi:hypothetical protein